MPRRTRSAVRASIILSIAAGAVLIAGATYIAYSRDLGAVRERLLADSRVLQTRHGTVEFAAGGDGPPVLALHGAGGGYDQGRAIARVFVGDGFRWIAPSRFGYLRSTLPPDASTPAQADGLAELLDALGIERVAVVAMSGGVPPALQFALRHPARTAALVLLSSAPFTPLTAGEQQLPIPSWLYQALFSSDLPYWTLTRVARPALRTIFDVKADLWDVLPPEEQAFVEEMVDAFAPVTMRADGLRNEAAAIDPRTRYPLQQVSAPTLVVHARDDGINPVAFGEYIARRVAGAELMSLASGGHLLLGNHASVRARVRVFLERHLRQDRWAVIEPAGVRGVQPLFLSAWRR